MIRFGVKFASVKGRCKLYLAIAAALSGNVYALPQGGQVVDGAADIEVKDLVMDVHQDSQRVILEYDSFNLDATETVNFIQPNSQAVALNRVLGSDLSEIHGSINANGQVFLINPNGVLFGAGAQVNVAGLVATTLDMDSQDFMAGGEELIATNASGRVENRGQIHGQNRVWLAAPEVINSGDIGVEQGTAVLAAGAMVFVQPSGSGIPMLVDDPELVGQVANTGTIDAREAVLYVSGGRTSGIKQQGLIRATEITGDGGRIKLIAGEGDIVNTGTLNASADSGYGGKVEIAANRYAQTGTINVDANGLGDGGQVDIRAQEQIALHSQSRITASGDQFGDGGKVVVFSDQATHFQSQALITARGGELSGDGGFVEVSGAQSIYVDGDVDVGAEAGEPGFWYIDPTDISISSAGSSGGSFVDGGGTFFWDLGVAPPGSSTINVTSIRNTLLTGGDVTIDTASAAGSGGNIVVANYIDYDGVPDGRTLTLTANNNITIQGNAGVTDSVVDGDSLNVILVAGGNINMQSNGNLAYGGGTLQITSAGNFSMASASGLLGGGGTTLNIGGQFTMNPGALVLLGGDFIANVNSNITVADITSVSTADTAIYLNSLAGFILDDGDGGTGLHAVDGGILLESVNSIANIPLDTSRLGIRNTGTGDININHTGDLTLTTLGLGNLNISISATGDLNYDGSLGSDLHGGNGTVTLTAGDTMTIAGDLTDSTGAVDATVNLDFNATNNFTVIDGAQINAGLGWIDITVSDGDAAITGLNSIGQYDLLAGPGAQLPQVRVNTPNGQILDAGDSARDVIVPLGWYQLEAMGNIVDIESNSDFVTASSTTGSIGLNELASFTALDTGFTAANTVAITTGNEFELPSNSLLNAPNFNVSAAGAIRLPDVLTVASSVSLVGADLSRAAGSPARQLTINTGTLNLDSTLTGGDLLVATNVTNLSVANRGPSTLTISEVDGLNLVGLRAEAGTTLIDTAGGFDLDIASAVDLDGNNGAFTLDAGGDLLINSSLVDGSGGVDNNTTITLLADNAIVFDPAAEIDAGLGSLNLAPTTILSLGRVAASDLVVNAPGGIVDVNGAGINIVAATADITSNGDIGNSTDSLETTLTQLSVDAGVGGVFLDNSSALTIAALNSGGDLVLRVSSGDLTLSQSNPTIVGTTSLDVTSGNLVINDAGLTLAGDLVLSAAAINDSGGAVSISATNAAVTLLNGGVDTTINSQFDDLIVDLLGSQRVEIRDADGLTVSGLSSAGDLVLASGGGADLLISDGAPSVTGDLSLISARDILLPNLAPATGLNTSGSLYLEGRNISMTGASSNLRLAASTGELLFSSNVDTSLLTDFTSLDLQWNSSNNLSISEASGLTINSLGGLGDIAILADGNLTFVPANIVHSGRLGLTTSNTGNLLLDDLGLITTGDLRIDVANISDSDSAVILQGGSADITLRQGVAATTINSSFNDLALTYGGTTDVTVIDSDGLTLLALDTGGNAVVTATAADLDVSSLVSAVAGELSLQSLATGNLLVDIAGFSHDGTLSVDVDGISDGDSDIILAATDANIQLRAPGAATVLNTSFDSLTLDYAGTSGVSVIDVDDLLLNGLVTAGNASIAVTDSDLDVSALLAAVAGDLTLQTLGSGNLLIDNAGFSHNGALNIDVDGIGDGDNDVILAATNAGIQLRAPGADTSFNTSFDGLTLDYQGTSTVTVVDSDGLSLNGLSAAGDSLIRTTGADLAVQNSAVNVAGDLSLNTTGAGNLVLADSGLLHGGLLQLDAANIVDSDQSVILAADNLQINLRDGSAASEFVTTSGVLSVVSAGSGALSVLESDDLTLNQLSTLGNANVTSAGDITLLNAINSAGLLSLTSQNAGRLTLLDSGLSTSGDLVIAVGSIGDSNDRIGLDAVAADIHLIAQTQPLTIDSQLQSLTLSHENASLLDIIQTGDLTLTAVAAGGDLNLTASNNVVWLDTAAGVAGNLGLTAAGKLTTPVLGLRVLGDLLLDVNELDNLVGGSSALLVADTAVLHVRGNGQDTSLDTQVSSLSLQYDSNNLLTVGVGDLTEISQINAGGNVLVSGSGDLYLSDEQTNIAGSLAIQSPGTVTLATAGLTHSGALAVAASDFLAFGGGTPILNANSADLTLSGDQALILDGQLAQLGLTYAGAAEVMVNNQGNLNLTRWQVPNSQSVGLNIAGLLALPNSGISSPGRLDIHATDLIDSDRTITMAANQLLVDITSFSGDGVWNLDVAELDLTLAGNANIAIDEVSGLELRDLDGDGFAVHADNSNIAVHARDGNLRIDDDVFASDLVADNNRRGMIDLSTGTGDILLATNRDSTIISSNLVDQNITGNGYAIRLAIEDSTTAARQILLGASGNAAVIRAVGGDVLLDSRGAADEQVDRTIVSSSGTLVEAFNSSADPLDGRVLVNGVQVKAESWQQIHRDRVLALVGKASEIIDLTGLDDIIDDLNDIITPDQPIVASSPKASEQFYKVFGECNELDKQSSRRCRVNEAIKAFFSHWLVGGEMPPKSELN